MCLCAGEKLSLCFACCPYIRAESLTIVSIHCIYVWQATIDSECASLLLMCVCTDLTPPLPLLPSSNTHCDLCSKLSAVPTGSSAICSSFRSMKKLSALSRSTSFSSFSALHLFLSLSLSLSHLFECFGFGLSSAALTRQTSVVTCALEWNPL